METTEEKYIVFVCNIHWNPKPVFNKKNNEKLPDQMSLDIPNQVLVQANKNKKNFNDIVETFCYNLLTKKYNHEVYNCQIWLPLEEDNQ